MYANEDGDYAGDQPWFLITSSIDNLIRSWIMEHAMQDEPQGMAIRELGRREETLARYPREEDLAQSLRRYIFRYGLVKKM